MAAEPHDFDPKWIDWTNTGGSDGQGFFERIKALEKWQRKHAGIDFMASGPDYPHPSQKVRALYFFEGNGRLDPAGIQIITTTAGETRGIYWLTAYTDTPDTATSGTSIVGGINGGVIKVLTMQALDSSGSSASISANATTDDGYINLSATGTDQAALLQWVPALTGTRTTRLGLTSNSSNPEGVVILLEPLVADPVDATNGQFFWRSDTGKFRVRIGGTFYNLATEDYVTAAATNHVPYVAKSADYTTTATDGLIAVDASGAARTITLITAVGNSGLQHTIKKTDSSTNIVTVDANSTQTIDGALTRGIPIQWGWLQVTSDGANWIITGRG